MNTRRQSCLVLIGALLLACYAGAAGAAVKVKSLCEVHYPSDDRIERDLPGYPASHGCVGLYDEEMQVEYYAAHDRKVNKQYYHPLDKPYLQGAQRLYEWVVDSERPRDPAPHQ